MHKAFLSILYVVCFLIGSSAYADTLTGKACKDSIKTVVAAVQTPAGLKDKVSSSTEGKAFVNSCESTCEGLPLNMEKVKELVTRRGKTPPNKQLYFPCAKVGNWSIGQLGLLMQSMDDEAAIAVEASNPVAIADTDEDDKIKEESAIEAPINEPKPAPVVAEETSSSYVNEYNSPISEGSVW